MKLVMFLMFALLTASAAAGQDIISEATRYRIKRACATCPRNEKILYTVTTIDRDEEHFVCYTCAARMDPDGAQNFKKIMEPPPRRKHDQ